MMMTMKAGKLRCRDQDDNDDDSGVTTTVWRTIVIPHVATGSKVCRRNVS